MEARNARQAAPRGIETVSNRLVGETEWQRKSRLSHPAALLGLTSKPPLPRHCSGTQSERSDPQNGEQRRNPRLGGERKLRQERKRRHEEFLEDLRRGRNEDLFDS